MFDSMPRLRETLCLYGRIAWLYATGQWSRTPDYDPVAEGYDVTWPHAMAAYNRELVMGLPDGVRTAVDLGCGTGAVTSLLAERFPNAQIDAVDVSGRMLEIAKKQSHYNGRVRWTQEEMIGYLRTRDRESADAIACAWAGAYVKMSQFARQSSRVLRPRGVLGLLITLRNSMPEV